MYNFYVSYLLQRRRKKEEIIPKNIEHLIGHIRFRKSYGNALSVFFFLCLSTVHLLHLQKQKVSFFVYLEFYALFIMWGCETRKEEVSKFCANFRLVSNVDIFYSFCWKGAVCDLIRTFNGNSLIHESDKNFFVQLEFKNRFEGNKKNIFWKLSENRNVRSLWSNKYWWQMDKKCTQKNFQISLLMLTKV